MNIIFYIILFLIGCVIGGLWAMQVRDIPQILDLRKTQYSNKKNNNKISYNIYLLLGGILIVGLANILNINMFEFDLPNFIIYVFAIIYISTLVIVAGIDKNYTKIDKKTLAFGIVVSIIYMLYLSVADMLSIKLNIFYLVLYILLLIVDSFLLRRFANDSYIVNLLMICVMILVFTDLKTLIFTLVMAVIAIGIYVLITNCQKRKNGNKKLKVNQIPVGFFVTSCNIIVLFMIRIIGNILV